MGHRPSIPGLPGRPPEGRPPTTTPADRPPRPDVAVPPPSPTNPYRGAPDRSDERSPQRIWWWIGSVCGLAVLGLVAWLVLGAGDPTARPSGRAAPGIVVSPGVPMSSATTSSTLPTTTTSTTLGGPAVATTLPVPVVAEIPPVPNRSDVYYGSCAEAQAAGVAPLYLGEPGYRPGLDRDKDGVACE